MFRRGISSLVAMVIVLAIMASVGVALYGYVHTVQRSVEESREAMSVDARARCFYLANVGRWLCVYRVSGSGGACSARFVCSDGIYNVSGDTSGGISIIVLPREVGKPVLLYVSCGSVSIATRVSHGYAR